MVLSRHFALKLSSLKEQEQKTGRTGNIPRKLPAYFFVWLSRKHRA